MHEDPRIALPSSTQSSVHSPQSLHPDYFHPLRPFAWDDLSHEYRFRSEAAHRVQLGNGRYHSETQTEVKHPQHLLVRDPAAHLDLSEDRQHRPATPPEHRLLPRRDDP